MNKIGDTLIHTGTNEELVVALIKHQVEFILIGGLAVSWFCSERQADDMDLLVNPTPENSKRLSKALSSLPYMNPCNPDEFTKPGLQWPQVFDASVNGKLFNHPIRIAGPTTLIQLKEHAIASLEVQSGKHLRDIELLRPYAV